MDSAEKKQSKRAKGRTAKQESSSRGVAAMSTQADRWLKKNSATLTEKLGEQSLSGSVTSVRLILSLSDRVARSGKARTKPAPRLSDTWMKEPEWGPEAGEAKAESAVAIGERER
jgi:hypothetical protein